MKKLCKNQETRNVIPLICSRLNVRLKESEYSSLQVVTMNISQSYWISFRHIDSSGRSLAGLRRSYIKLVRLRRMREAYACKRNDDKRNKGVEDEEKASMWDVARKCGTKERVGSSEEARIDQSRPSDRQPVVSRASTWRQVPRTLFPVTYVPRRTTLFRWHSCNQDTGGKYYSPARRQLYIPIELATENMQVK